MSPNTFFLPVDTDPATCPLSHGTSAAALVRIAEEGLKPRLGRAGETNWELHPSHEGAVYLTSAYAMYYASCAMGDGLAAVLDIDAAALDPDHLVADEDSYALAKVQDYAMLEDMSLGDRVAFWRTNLEVTDASQSLHVLGNCAYLGAIPPAAIRAVRLLARKEVSTLTLGVSDPAINPANFKLLGGMNQRFCAWLLGRASTADDELTAWFESVCRPSLPVMSLQEAAAFARAGRA